MKKKLIALLAAVALLSQTISLNAYAAPEISAETADPVLVESFEFTGGNSHILKDTDASKTITAEASPSDADNLEVDVASEDEAVFKAEIKQSLAQFTTIKVTPTGYGKAKLNVASKDGNATASADITVCATDFTLTGCALNIGKSKELEAKFALPGLSNSDISWKSSDEKIAKVDQSGKVTAVANGKAMITATLTKAVNAGAESDIVKTCEVNVCTPAEQIVPVKKAYTIYEGKIVKLATKVLPEDTTDKSVTYKSSDEKIATVDADGNVVGVSNGQAVITITTKDGSNVTTQVTVNVLAVIENIETKEEKYEVQAGKTLDIPVTVTSKNTNYIPFLYADSSDATIAETLKFVKTKDGAALRVTGVKEGEADITITTVDTFDHSLTFKVTVTKEEEVKEEEKPQVVEKATPITKVMIDDTLYLVQDDTATLAKCDTKESGAVKIPAYITANDQRIKVTQIGANAFKNCKKITSVRIPATVTDIADNAFYGCKKLASVDIPASVTTIGKKAFYGCSKLKKVTIKSKSITQIGSGAFVRNAKSATIKVPSSRLKAYKKLLKGKTTKGAKITK